MSKEQYLEDLKEIKEIMNRSTRFITLSGWSGISTGIVAITGALLAYLVIFQHNNYLKYESVELGSVQVWKLISIAAVTLFAAICCVVFFTKRKIKESEAGLLDIQTKQLLIHIFIPLITGGVLCLMLLSKGFIGILAPLTMIFYGLALVSGSKYTIIEIRHLGIIELLTGLISLLFIEYVLYFWAFGFGLLHIIYGLIIHKKY